MERNRHPKVVRTWKLERLKQRGDNPVVKENRPYAAKELAGKKRRRE